MNDLHEADAALLRYDAFGAVAAYARADAAALSDRTTAGLVKARWMSRHWAAARESLKRLDAHDTVYAELARGVVALGRPDRLWCLGVDNGSADRDDEAALAAYTAAVELDLTCLEAHAGRATALRMAGGSPRHARSCRSWTRRSGARRRSSLSWPPVRSMRTTTTLPPNTHVTRSRTTRTRCGRGWCSLRCTTYPLWSRRCRAGVAALARASVFRCGGDARLGAARRSGTDINTGRSEGGGAAGPG
jgi:hypothetical protein